jgi:hypothetical protein
MLKTRQEFMKSQINILILSFCLILSAFTTFGQNEELINSGYVFIDGKCCCSLPIFSTVQK